MNSRRPPLYSPTIAASIAEGLSLAEFYRRRGRFYEAYVYLAAALRYIDSVRRQRPEIRRLAIRQWTSKVRRKFGSRIDLLYHGRLICSAIPTRKAHRIVAELTTPEVMIDLTEFGASGGFALRKSTKGANDD